MAKFRYAPLVRIFTLLYFVAKVTPAIDVLECGDGDTVGGNEFKGGRRVRVSIDRSYFGSCWSFEDDVFEDVREGWEEVARCSDKCELVIDPRDADVVILPGHKVGADSDLYGSSWGTGMQPLTETNQRFALVCTEPFCHAHAHMPVAERRKKQILTIGYHALMDLWTPFACRRWLRLAGGVEGDEKRGDDGHNGRFSLPNIARIDSSVAPVAAFVSNCWAETRSAFLRELGKHVRVDSYGTCEHNADLPKNPAAGSTNASILSSSSSSSLPPTCDAEVATSPENANDQETHLRRKRLDPVSYYDRKIRHIREQGYAFVVAFENSELDGYVTEKAIQAYEGGAIPIYFGAPDAASLFGRGLPMIDARSYVPPLLHIDHENEDSGGSVYGDARATSLAEDDVEGTNETTRRARRYGRAMAVVVSQEIHRYMKDPSALIRRWRRHFGRGRNAGIFRQGPTARQCAALDDGGVLAATPIDDATISTSTRSLKKYVRSRTDHSDMFSLDELLCASCEAAYRSMTTFSYAGCYVVNSESSLESFPSLNDLPRAEISWSREQLTWIECRHRALLLGHTYFVIGSSKPPNTCGSGRFPSASTDDFDLNFRNLVAADEAGACNREVDVDSSHGRNVTFVRTLKIGGGGGGEPGDTTASENRPVAVALYTVSSEYAYVGCFLHRSQALVQHWNTGNGVTWEECREFARRRGAPWFAMEYPSGYEIFGAASCGMGGVSYRREGQVDDRYCERKRDVNGRPLGGKSLMAVYLIRGFLEPPGTSNV